MRQIANTFSLNQLSSKQFNYLVSILKCDAFAKSGNLCYVPKWLKCGLYFKSILIAGVHANQGSAGKVRLTAAVGSGSCCQERLHIRTVKRHAATSSVFHQVWYLPHHRETQDHYVQKPFQESVSTRYFFSKKRQFFSTFIILNMPEDMLQCYIKECIVTI